jgi:hypothetical protein
MRKVPAPERYLREEEEKKKVVGCETEGHYQVTPIFASGNTKP